MHFLGRKIIFSSLKFFFLKVGRLTVRTQGIPGADGCQTNRERGVTTTAYSTLLVYLQIRTSIYTTFTQ